MCIQFKAHFKTETYLTLLQSAQFVVGLLRDNIDETANVAFQSYLGVVSSPPVGYEDFTAYKSTSIGNYHLLILLIQWSDLEY